MKIVAIAVGVLGSALAVAFALGRVLSDMALAQDHDAYDSRG